MTAFAQDYDVVAIDMRGYNTSDKPKVRVVRSADLPDMMDCSLFFWTSRCCSVNTLTLTQLTHGILSANKHAATCTRSSSQLYGPAFNNSVDFPYSTQPC